MKKIKVAQLGVGYWGPNLLRNLLSNHKCEVQCVVDLSLERRLFVENLNSTIDVQADSNSVFEDEGIEAVVIATPARTHFQLVMRALEAGKHVLVEKPMATTVEEVDLISQIAEEKELVAMVGHTFLYNQCVQFIKRVIDQGDIGTVRYIYSQRLNLGRIRRDVNALWNLAPHDVSILQYWLNEPEPIHVSMNGMCFVQESIEDVAFLNITYPNNIMAHCHVSWLDPQKVRQITVVGSKKMIVYDDLADNKVAIYDKGIDRMAVLGEGMDFDQSPLFTLSHRSGDVILPKIEWKEPLQLEVNHFLDCIMGQDECLTSTQHARNVIQILSLASDKNRTHS